MNVLFGHLSPKISLPTVHSKLSDIDAHAHLAEQACLLNTEHSPVQIGSLIISYTGEPLWLQTSLCKLKKQRGFAPSLAQAYKAAGIDCIKQLNGSFIIIIHDIEKNKTTIAVDKMGISRLVYQDQNGLSFSNSIKTIQKYSSKSLGIDNQAIFNYIYFHMIPSPGSFFEGIKKLEPAHYLEYENGQLKKTRYWEPTFSEETSLSSKQLSEKLHAHLKTAVKRSIPEGSVGAFLSGGLDSSTVSGNLASFRSNPDTFTIGFDAEGYDETPYARIVSRHFHTKHHEYFVTPQDVLDAVPKIAAAYDEPFGNSSAIPTYFCAKLAKENGCDTLLAGDGGDELFAGNERYAKQKIFETYNNSPSFLRAMVNAPYKGYPALKNKRLFS
ncbi:MAG: hypothetical protein COB62_07235, partial [Piscirickettsiaceae bacterium]